MVDLSSGHGRHRFLLGTLVRGAAPCGYQLLIVTLIAFNLWRILNHVPWGDEWQAWLIATESTDFRAVLQQTRREGHPALWYLLLHAAGTVTDQPVAMQLLHWLIGALIYLLVGFAAPFRLHERLLILLSYALFFEYVIPSRGYGLGALFLLAFAWLRQRRSDAFLLSWLALGLAANTNMFAALVAAGLGAGWLLTTPPSLWRQQVAGLAVFAPLLAVALASAVPPVDQLAAFAATRAENLTESETAPVFALGSAVVNATAEVFLPLEDRFPASFWNPTFGPDWLRALLGLPVLLALAWIFWPEKDLLLTFGLCLAGVVAFGALVWSGLARHHAVVYIAFVVVLWLLSARGRSLPRVAVLLLTLNALGGIQAAVGERLRPFSRSADTAAWIEANGHAGAFWMAAPDHSGISVAGQLGRPIFYLECMCTSRFVPAGVGHDLKPRELHDRVVQALSASGRSEGFLLLAGDMIDAIRPDGANPELAIEPLVRFEGAEAVLDRLSENFALYRIALPADRAAR